MFLSAHYGGEDLVPKFGERENWKKVFGPVFMYLNFVTQAENPLLLWEDAKEQVLLYLLFPSHKYIYIYIYINYSIFYPIKIKYKLIEYLF